MLRPGIRVLGAAAPLCIPTAPSAVQCPSRDNVLFPGDRAGHQRSLHLFIFLNISYFERMINNKESEIGMGTLSALFCFFSLGKRDVWWAGGEGSPMARQNPNRVLQAAQEWLSPRQHLRDHGGGRGVPSPH